MDNLLRDLVMKKEKPMSRRAMLRAAGCGIGFLGLADVLAREAQAATSFNPLAPKAPHFEPRAKRVIFLFMHGGPSSIDTFDPKPRLDRDNGKPLPIKRPLAFADEAAGPLMKSPWAFKQAGQCGLLMNNSLRLRFGNRSEVEAELRSLGAKPEFRLHFGLIVPFD